MFKDTTDNLKKTICFGCAGSSLLPVGFSLVVSGIYSSLWCIDSLLRWLLGAWPLGT